MNLKRTQSGRIQTQKAMHLYDILEKAKTKEKEMRSVISSSWGWEEGLTGNRTLCGNKVFYVLTVTVLT